jgi:hypothetical protein
MFRFASEHFAGIVMRCQVFVCVLKYCPQRIISFVAGRNRIVKYNEIDILL